MKTTSEVFKSETGIELSYINPLCKNLDLAIADAMKAYARQALEEAAEDMQIQAESLWEQDQKTNPNPVDPYAFVYGIKCAKKVVIDKINKLK